MTYCPHLSLTYTFVVFVDISFSIFCLVTMAKNVIDTLKQLHFTNKYVDTQHVPSICL